MARKPARKSKTPRRAGPLRSARRFLLRWLRRIVLAFVALVCVGVALFAFVNPPTTLYMASESGRLGGVAHEWVDLEDVAPVMARSVVAAEDANFCIHWGFDMTAIRKVIEDGENRGASTLTQQVVKNVYLWPARSYVRKALEAAITPVVELVWTKRRIVEVYLNVAEFDEGVFGVQAAASHYFGVTPDQLTPTQAARLAAILPSPKDRSASRPGQFTQARAASIMDGAATILRDGRADCFED
ncbi:monofunctional biosynthetic peptidoglycan transglycosylase [Maritimibacter sp. DP07]|uniref:Biosynthetic peptidoglycan transglycosylase n=1 Tax=Maritimibacter harenae TaxID=2606218 RepID=A0A845M531_9RHOB|nr:monofunctional biosynthetic peptidoglycan transglycosylase [Maritimibacter harenae]MZR15145.1 monofunctional biosynthetic peptidoglycan transglycosylase [Maritimibacter harenae]